MRPLAVAFLAMICASCAPIDPASRPRSLLVFFHESSASLDQEARDAVAAAATVLRKQPDATVKVVGYDDPEGSLLEDIDISRRRARAVAAALVNAGVPAGNITQQGRGATDYAAAASESRRVEILLNAR